MMELWKVNSDDETNVFRLKCGQRRNRGILIIAMEVRSRFEEQLKRI